MATSSLPSRGPRSGRKCHITLAFSGVPFKRTNSEVAPSPLPYWRPKGGRKSISALFWAREKARVRQPVLILSFFVWGSPRMQGRGTISALFCAPREARVRQPLLILSRFVWGPLRMHFCLLLGPREGKVQVATSEFVPLFFWDARECRGDVAFPPSFGPPRRQG